MIAWIDVETTGLDPEAGTLLEVALVITDDELNEKFVFTHHMDVDRTGEVLAQMDSYVRDMHARNGLWEEVLKGGGASACFVVESCAPAIAQHDEGGPKLVLAGSSVGFDRAWLKKHLPDLEEMFHYRSIDVSSITELAKRWAPEVYAGRPQGVAAHRALPDVRASIATLKYYRDVGFLGRGK